MADKAEIEALLDEIQLTVEQLIERKAQPKPPLISDEQRKAIDDLDVAVGKLKANYQM